VALERIGDEPVGPDWRVPAEYREEYHAGEALTEPIGIPHRAGNPDSAVECVSVTLLLTEVDRHHIIRLGSEKPIGTPI
jgi:hypothetical protein